MTPSGVDEQTFKRVFGGCDWALMGILGRTGRIYARLRFNAGPGGALEIATSVDWSLWPEYAISQQFFDDIDLWQTEFDHLVEPLSFLPDPAQPDGKTQNPFALGLDHWLRSDNDPFLTRTLHDFE